MSSTLLPPNATAFERAVDVTGAGRLAVLPVNINSTWSAANCPPQVLAHLAWALSVDVWDAAWPLDLRRAVVAASAEVHRRKGTVGAVRRAVGALAIDAEITEWWQQQPTGPAHTFALTLWLEQQLSAPGAPILDERVIAQLHALVDEAKPARSHYSLAVGLGAGAGLALKGAAVSLHCATATGRPSTPALPPGRSALTLAASAKGLAIATKSGRPSMPPLPTARAGIGAAAALRLMAFIHVGRAA
jgi:phage tail P2-like protein